MTTKKLGPHTLLCWHAERAGLVVLERAIKALRNRKVEIGRVLYLVQQGGKLELPMSVEAAQVSPLPLVLADPTQHANIYALIRDQVVPRLADIGGPLHINVSPGTPAMHAVWLILHASGVLPEGTRLWSSQYNRETKRSRIDRVEFSVNTYLAEIHQLERADPDRAIYEPDAKSPARKRAFEHLVRYAKVPGAPLLILGQRGTGKTRLVETHVATLKQRPNVVTVACGGLDSSLAESLLFGHRKGAIHRGCERSQGASGRGRWWDLVPRRDPGPTQARTTQARACVPGSLASVPSCRQRSRAVYRRRAGVRVELAHH